MSTAVGEHEQMTSAARLYYLDGLGQHEIAAILGVSRSTVSRLLAAARERGIVRISVAPFEPRDTELEKQLQDRFGLHHAVVIKAKGRPVDSVRRTIGYFAAPVLAQLFQSRMTIGIAGGRTIGEVVDALPPTEQLRGVHVAQLMGYIDPTAQRFDAPEVGRSLAQRLSGTFYTLHAPVFVDDVQTRDALLAHEHIRLLWRQFEALDLTIVGIGALDESMFFERGVLDRQECARLRGLGVVGEICGRFFDAEGRECATTYRDRVISIDLDLLRKGREVIGVTNGPIRREAIRAALRGRLLTSLVIDDTGAETLLGKSSS